MFCSSQRVRYSLIASTLLATCFSHGQVAGSVDATLQPSGEVRYQATYLFHLERDTDRLVPNAPYSADEVEYSANGEQRRHLRTIYRDSKGNTRIEQPLSLGSDSIQGPTLVHIFDTASGWIYVLDAQARVAHRYRPLAPGMLPHAVPARQVVEAVKSETGQPARRSTVPVAESSENLQPPKVASLPVTSPGYAAEDLGEKHLDGLLVRGTRFVTPVVSEDGTRRTMTSEVWTSPELEIVVLSASLNQQPGDRFVRLVHLTRTEPDASLFEVPAGYQIQTETTDFNIAASFKQPRPSP